METKEPYRATKLWNEVITSFQFGMPLKKHRRIMHCYDKCFMASDGVTWLHCYLLNNPNFGSDVTRQQTINLLQKFVKCHVIDCITSKSKKSEFCDNSHLYRFTTISPQKTKTLPLRLVQSPSLLENSKKEVGNFRRANSIRRPLSATHKENLPECHLVEKKMSLSEIEKMWKTATINMLENQLNCPITDIADEKTLNGHFIRHNVTRISKTGVVALIDKTDDIPHWVISAMKCLANWPNASGSGSCLPNYPGFEKDVFKVVRDFFLNTQTPLIPETISSILLHVFCSIMKRNCSFPHNSSLVKTQDNCKLSLSPSEIKTSTPVIDHAIAVSYSSVPNLGSDGKLLLDDPEVMWDYPSSVSYETDFATSDPVTRVVPDYLSLEPSLRYYQGSMESISTISVCSVTLKPDVSSDLSTPLKSWNSDFYLSNLFHRDSSLERSGDQKKSNLRHTHSMSDFLHKTDSEADNLNTSDSSTKTVTYNEKSLSFGNLNVGYVKYDSHTDCLKESSGAIYSKKAISSPLNNISRHSEKMAQNIMMCKQEETYPEELKATFQLILLFLSPPNRRQLHLLFRVINKILKNGKFILDVNASMHDYLLQTFLPAIIQTDVNYSILVEIVNYILDNCEQLFQIPSGLKEEADKLSKHCKGRIAYSVDDASCLTYCELVSKQQYEDQKVTVSAKALKSLLFSIMEDKNLSDKEQKKRLKQFKENHPEVYYAHFPQELKQRSKKSFLNKIAIRL